MTLTERLTKVKRIFLDTAPVIYWVERHTTYAESVRVVLDRVDDGTLMAATASNDGWIPVTTGYDGGIPYRPVLILPGC